MTIPHTSYPALRPVAFGAKTGSTQPRFGNDEKKHSSVPAVEDLYPPNTAGPLGRLLGRLLKPRRPYEKMSGLQLLARQPYEENYHPDFSQHEKHIIVGGIFAVLGALYASFGPAYVSFFSDGGTLDKMTPDTLVTSAHANLTPEKAEKLAEGKLPLAAGDHFKATMPDGTAIEVTVKDSDKNPDTPLEIFIQGHTDGSGTGLENRALEVVLNEEDLNGLAGASPVLTDDGNPDTSLLHLVDRDTETSASKEWEDKSLWEQAEFFSYDQRFNLGWGVSGLGGLWALLAAYKGELNQNASPAEVERQRRKEAKKKSV